MWLQPGGVPKECVRGNIAKDGCVGRYTGCGLRSTLGCRMRLLRGFAMSAEGGGVSMGMYVNPGNEGFAEILRGSYVDKTGLIGLINDVLSTRGKLVCVSRPRRFGKSYAAESLVAYYARGYDSRVLFEGLEVSRRDDFEKHLNAHDVIRLDMTSFTSIAHSDVVAAVREALLDDLRSEFPEAPRAETLEGTLYNVASSTGRGFVFIIDEWDAVFREMPDDAAAQRAYVLFLRSLFKNASLTSKVVEGAYMTGILPIKKYGNQSAVSDFDEFTMLQPYRFAPYVGLTEGEVRALCDAQGMDFEQMRRWYDGYELPGVGAVYNPCSVMKALRNKAFGTYWSASETYESLRTYIDMDFDGLQQDIVQMIGGASLPVNPRRFQNDMTSIETKDDVLTLLMHLGYLAYDEQNGTARIPNEEIRLVFRDTVEVGRHAETARIICESDQLLRDTIEGNEAGVAAALQRAHDAGCAPLFYNDEQALRAVVRAAYISAADHYATIQELPSGHGYADVVFIPKRRSSYPAIIVELKWDKPVEAALEQIHSHGYPTVLKQWGGPVLLVGITYDVETKTHACKIEVLETHG